MVDSQVETASKPDRPWGKPQIAACLSVLSMGLGQLYNRQWAKGVFFLLIQFSYLGVFFDFLNIGLWGIVTLGTIPKLDHSILLLAQGIISLLIIALGLVFYFLNIRDAYKVGKIRERGEEPPGIKETYQTVTGYGYPYLLVAPGLFLLIAVVVFPLLFMIFLAFTNYDLYHSPPAKLVDWVGFDNFFNLFRSELWQNSFISVFQWTVVFTLVSTTVQFGLGLFLAILIHQKRVRFKKFWRTVLILPWAVPAFVSILVFTSLFDNTFGPINAMLTSLGLGGVPWMTDPFWTKIAILLIQFWLGFPFSMALCTGVLQGISSDLYEAAEVDGATPFQKFRSITLPLVLYATAPVLITQYAFNFNNFNIIYLFNEGGPPIPGSTAGGTDILISWVYKLTFDSFKYNYAAAVTIIIALVVMSISVYQFRRTRSFKEEDLIQ
ncbi:carbohydrate ABC transporter membrane protein 1 (CUT1 family) [Melghirimyces profundicolus]|uniref:Carbohydrate ABC transporter membrane protein 1 (CUT1 family) n=1 Tax=Melghirimyces profundicolus TaxID=1242148 RepID=A0A2T6C9L3_9BACL|nr:sugar ABC transporter permease [Melghirimyces profundicolus]PTX65001.1 carbohydrate ABC transporter membrane protein 1 (CUT1 family) [Melghirimyces profundicolus]